MRKSIQIKFTELKNIVASHSNRITQWNNLIDKLEEKLQAILIKSKKKRDKKMEESIRYLMNKEKKIYPQIYEYQKVSGKEMEKNK